MRNRLRSLLGSMVLMGALLAGCGGDPAWESSTYELNAASAHDSTTQATHISPSQAITTPVYSTESLPSGSPLQLRQAAWETDDDPVPINGQRVEEAAEGPLPNDSQTAREGDDDPVPINGQAVEDPDDDPVPINGQAVEDPDDDPVPIKGHVNIDRLDEDSSDSERLLTPALADRVANAR